MILWFKAMQDEHRNSSSSICRNDSIYEPRLFQWKPYHWKHYTMNTLSNSVWISVREISKERFSFCHTMDIQMLLALICSSMFGQSLHRRSATHAITSFNTPRVFQANSGIRLIHRFGDCSGSTHRLLLSVQADSLCLPCCSYLGRGCTVHHLSCNHLKTIMRIGICTRYSLLPTQLNGKMSQASRSVYLFRHRIKCPDLVRIHNGSACQALSQSLYHMRW